MDGQWRQSGQLTDVQTGDSHIHLGAFDLVQHAQGQFDGTGSQSGVCTSSPGATYTGPLSDGLPFEVLDGRVSGDSVEFRTPLCQYTGHFTDADQWRMIGYATCSYSWNGVDYRFEGQWQADR